PRNPVVRPNPGARTATPTLAGPRWVLIQNPRHGATRGEPEYVWVEEDKIPGTLNTVLFGKDSILAPQDVVASYGPPPSGGRISALQGGATAGAVASLRPRASRASLDSPRSLTPEVTPRGYVIYIDEGRVVVDLTSLDGVKPGAILSLRRERIPLKHPVTGEYLGELDEEIGTARVVEIRERFSVAEVREIRAGFQLRVKDRVVVVPE
ncbi:MAG: hypothetical protein ACE5KY_02525, partial [Candidatus Tectimicrobiota bacterium]